MKEKKPSSCQKGTQSQGICTLDIKFIKKMRLTVKRWNSLSVDIIQTLCAVNAILASQKSQHLWKDFCFEIGLDQKTADRWLSRLGSQGLLGEKPPKANNSKRDKKRRGA